MKKVIEGKLYDTETADILHAWDNNLPNSDFNNCAEALYRTRNGRFFIEGIGGAMSRWSESCSDNSRSGGKGILPLGVDDALVWAEEHEMPVDAIVEVFGARVTEA